jgi:phage-related protein
MMKHVVFLGDSLEQIRAFPARPRRDAGFQLDRVQRGLDPDDWKPMAVVGSGVREIRVRDTTGAYRVIYIASFADAIYVLHAFHKKTQRTSPRDITLAQLRFRNLKQRGPQ